MEELLDRVDTDMKDIWGALTKAAVSGVVCVLACMWCAGINCWGGGGGGARGVMHTIYV